ARNNLDGKDREEFRSRRVHTLFEEGKGLAAYENIGPRKATFDQLALLAFYAENGKLLEALVDAHRKADPHDKDLPGWEAEVHWLKKEYAKVALVLTEHRQEVLAKSQPQWRFKDRLVRSLVRLKRLDEALKEYKALKEDSDPLYAAIILAMAGDVA